ncbi:MAG: glycoside hydrolase family 127 protein [Terriglobia bacterium]
MFTDTPGRPAGPAQATSLVVLTLALMCAGRAPASAQTPNPPGAVRLREIPLQRITIEDKFWSPRLEVNRTKTLDHVYKELETTGCIRNFDIAAKKATGTFGGPWWADSDVYKWIEGASYVLATHPDPALDRKVDDLIARIAAAQQPDGYLNTHVQIEEPDLRFKDLAFFHEDFSSGHLFEAAVAHYEATGKRTLLDVAIKLADCFDATFGSGKRDGLSGHEGIELAWVRLYRATGDDRYLKLAEFYLNERGKKPSIFQREYENLPADRTVLWRAGQPINLRALQDYLFFKPLATRLFLTRPTGFDTSYSQDNLPVREQRVAVGHAVRAMFLYSGMADVAYETGDQGLLDALDRLHDSITLRRMYVTGGIGPSAKNEGFTDDYDLPNDNAYQETCASAGMVLWNYRMFKLTGDGQYVDLLEQSLYNAVLAGVSLEGNTFCYATPLACDVKFTRQPWFEVPCCPTTAARFFPSIGRYAYNQSADGVWVNLYLGGSATVTLADGARMVLHQTTRYPWNGSTRLQVDVDRPQETTLHLRVPGWASASSFTLNGKPIQPGRSKGYAHLHRKWAKGDVVELSFPMEVVKLEANPNVLQSRGEIALRRGPLIYCLEQPDNQADLDRIALSRGAKLDAHFEPALLGGVTVITGEGRLTDLNRWENQLYRPVRLTTGEAISIKAIPYCVWGNRGQKKMKVWIDSTAP